MSRTLTVNAAQIVSTSIVVDPASGNASATAVYTVGYKDPVSRSYTAYQGAAEQGIATLVVPAASTAILAGFAQLEALIASQEGLDLTAGDSVSAA